MLVNGYQQTCATSRRTCFNETKAESDNPHLPRQSANRGYPKQKCRERGKVWLWFTLIQNWNERVTSEDTVYVLGDAFWKNEENSIRIMERLQGHKHLIQGNHDRVKGKLLPYWESIEQYAEVNDENRLVILSHYPILFYKNQHYGAVMLYGHVHNTREWELVEKWKKEQWAMGIPSRLINVGCMMDYMRYTPRTLTELLDANPMPEIARDRKDGSAVESAE